MKRAVLAAAFSTLVPGAGQLVNGQPDKAIGLLAAFAIAGASFLGAIPLLRGAATLILGATWLYAVVDAFLVGRVRRRGAVPLSGQRPRNVRSAVTGHR